jgi:hypothetical protein
VAGNAGRRLLSTVNAKARSTIWRIGLSEDYMCKYWDSNTVKSKLFLWQDKVNNTKFVHCKSVMTERRVTYLPKIVYEQREKHELKVCGQQVRIKTSRNMHPRKLHECWKTRQLGLPTDDFLNIMEDSAVKASPYAACHISPVTVRYTTQ